LIAFSLNVICFTWVLNHNITKYFRNGNSYFNLVFKSNKASVMLWESIGFERVAKLENAARLKGLETGYLDTAFGYRYDLEKLPSDYLGID